MTHDTNKSHGIADNQLRDLQTTEQNQQIRNALQNDINELEKQKVQASAELERHKQEKEKLEAEQSQNEKRLEELQQHIQETKVEQEHLDQEIDRLEKEQTRMEQELEEKQDELEQNEQQLEQLQGELDQIKERLQQQQDDKEYLEEEHEVLEREKAEAEQKINQLQAQINHLEQEIKQETERLRALENDIQRIENEIQQIEEDIQRHERDLEQKEQQVEQIGQDLSKLEDACDRLQQETDRIEDMMERIKEVIDMKKNEKEEAEQLKTKLQNDLQQVRQQHQIVQQEVQQLNQQIDQIQQTIVPLENQVRESANVIQQLVQELQKMNADAEQWRQKAAEKQKEFTQLNQQEKETIQELQQKQSAHATAEKERQELSQKLVQLSNESDTLQKEVARLDNEKKQCSEQLKQEQTLHKQSVAAMKSAEEELGKAESELRKQEQITFTSLQNLQKSKEEEEKAKQALEQANEDEKRAQTNLKKSEDELNAKKQIFEAAKLAAKVIAGVVNPAAAAALEAAERAVNIVMNLIIQNKGDLERRQNVREKREKDHQQSGTKREEASKVTETEKANLQKQKNDNNTRKQRLDTAKQQENQHKSAVAATNQRHTYLKNQHTSEKEKFTAKAREVKQTNTKLQTNNQIMNVIKTVVDSLQAKQTDLNKRSQQANTEAQNNEAQYQTIIKVEAEKDNNLKQTQQQHAGVQQQLQGKRGEVANVQNQVKAKQNEEQTILGKVSNAENALILINKSVTELQHDLREQKKEHDAAAREKTKKETEAQRIKAVALKLESEKTHLEDECRRLERELQNKDRSLSEKQNESNQLKDDLNAHSEDLKSKRSQIQHHEQTKMTVNSSLDENKRKTKLIDKKIKEITVEMEAKNKEKQAAEQQFKESQREVKNKERDIANSKKSLSEKKQEHENGCAKQIKFEDELNQLKNNKNDFDHRLSEMKQNYDARVLSAQQISKQITQKEFEMKKPPEQNEISQEDCKPRQSEVLTQEENVNEESDEDEYSDRITKLREAAKQNKDENEQHNDRKEEETEDDAKLEILNKFEGPVKDVELTAENKASDSDQSAANRQNLEVQNTTPVAEASISDKNSMVKSMIKQFSPVTIEKKSTINCSEEKSMPKTARSTAETPDKNTVHDMHQITCIIYVNLDRDEVYEFLKTFLFLHVQGEDGGAINEQNRPQPTVLNMDGNAHMLPKGSLLDLFVRQVLDERGTVTFTRPRTEFQLVEPVCLTDEYGSWTFDLFQRIFDIRLSPGDSNNDQAFPTRWKLAKDVVIKYKIYCQNSNTSTTTGKDNSSNPSPNIHTQRPSTVSLETFIRTICEIEDNGMGKNWFESLIDHEDITTYAHLTEITKCELLANLHMIKLYFLQQLEGEEGVNKIPQLEAECVEGAFEEMRSEGYEDDGLFDDMKLFFQPLTIKDNELEIQSTETDACERQPSKESTVTDEIKQLSYEYDLINDKIESFRKLKSKIEEESRNEYKKIQQEKLEYQERIKLNLDWYSKDIEGRKQINLLKVKISQYKRDLKHAEMVKTEKENLLKTIKTNLAKDQSKINRELIQLHRGFIMYGPPGTGKSHLMSKLASKIGIAMLAPPLASGNLERSLVGQSEALISSLCRRAKRLPHLICCLSIDEIDSLAPKRDDKSSEGKVSKISVLLSMLEGAENVPNLMFFSATNLLHRMDDAFLRRMSGKFFVGRPSSQSRKRILGKLPLTLLQPEILEKLAIATTNFSGSALTRLVSEIATHYSCQRRMNKDYEISEEDVLTLADRTARHHQISFGLDSLPNLQLQNLKLLKQWRQRTGKTTEELNRHTFHLPKKRRFTGRILISLSDRCVRIETEKDFNVRYIYEEQFHETEQKLQQLLERITAYGTDRNVQLLQLIDLNLLSSKGAYDEQKVSEVLKECYDECVAYKRSMIVYDLDSLIGVNKSESDSSMGTSVSSSVVNQRIYLYVTSRFGEAKIDIGDTDDDKSLKHRTERWAVAIVRDRYLLKKFTNDVDFPLTEQQEEEEEEKERLSRDILECVKCRDNYIESENKMGQCIYHDGFIYDNSDLHFQRYRPNDALNILNQDEFQALQDPTKKDETERRKTRMKYICCGGILQTGSAANGGCKKGKHGYSTGTNRTKKLLTLDEEDIKAWEDACYNDLRYSGKYLALFGN
ncbi:unnamed protein product [Adineta steineri]|uniref:AAA+ ATPase domain-containing protein n=1 Tax=Adineta steineri TaxID=433720 RepID=A0A819HIS3_9BILA|nr:unnamed protein product [Adineta steineri]CAF3902678.1 unnamed protein product [Adineta steineri]